MKNVNTLPSALLHDTSYARVVLEGKSCRIGEDKLDVLQQSARVDISAELRRVLLPARIDKPIEEANGGRQVERNPPHMGEGSTSAAQYCWQPALATTEGATFSLFYYQAPSSCLAAPLSEEEDGLDLAQTYHYDEGGDDHVDGNDESSSDTEWCQEDDWMRDFE